MEDVGRIVVKLVIFLFTLLFIIPAILFSVLVIGLTDHLKSGAFMLVSALVLKIMVKLNGINPRSSARKRSYSSMDRENSAFGNWSPQVHFDDNPPPPLRDIYIEIDDQKRETEKLHRLIIEQESELVSKKDRSK